MASLFIGPTDGGRYVNFDKIVFFEYDKAHNLFEMMVQGTDEIYSAGTISKEMFDDCVRPQIMKPHMGVTK